MPAGNEALLPAGRSPALRHELARKAIHVTTCLAAAALVWTTAPAFLPTLFAGAAALALAIDMARLRVPALHDRFSRLFRALLRPHEQTRLSGATMLAAGFALTVVLFPRPYAVVGLLYAGLADSAGALVGRALGRHPFPWGKTLEGSAAFLFAGALAGWVVPGVDLPGALLAAIPVTLLESAPLGLDDNLFVPLAGAGATLLVALLR